MPNNHPANDDGQAIDPEEQRLLEEYEQLTLKLHKQKLILSALKNIDCNTIKNVDEAGKKNIDMALNYVRAYDYLKMDNAGTNVLGNFDYFIVHHTIQSANAKRTNTLANCCCCFLFCFTGIPDKPLELSYTEKRALKLKALEELPKQYEKELELCRQIDAEIDESAALDKEILELKMREKDMIDDLVREKTELCEKLVECADLRFGPSLESGLKITKAKFGVEQVKAQ